MAGPATRGEPAPASSGKPSSAPERTYPGADKTRSAHCAPPAPTCGTPWRRSSSTAFSAAASMRLPSPPPGGTARRRASRCRPAPARFSFASTCTQADAVGPRQHQHCRPRAEQSAAPSRFRRPRGRRPAPPRGSSPQPLRRGGRPDSPAGDRRRVLELVATQCGHAGPPAPRAACRGCPEAAVAHHQMRSPSRASATMAATSASRSSSPASCRRSVPAPRASQPRLAA